MKKQAKRQPVADRRKSPRKSCHTAVAYATRGFSSIEYIQDISAWGVFIRTPKVVPVGEDIAMTIPKPGSQASIKIIGEVVRNSPEGIGVKFKMGIDESVIKPILEKN